VNPRGAPFEAYIEDAVDVITQAADRWDDALVVAALLAVDEEGLKGVCLDAGPGPARDAWLAMLKSFDGRGAQHTALPANADEGRVLGGLDLVATLAEGKPVLREGLLRQADGQTLVVRMAERLRSSTVHALANALDEKTVRLERDGFSAAYGTTFLTVLLNEGEENEPISEKLVERLAFRLNLDGIPRVCLGDALAEFSAQQVKRARAALQDVTVSDEVLTSFAKAGLAVGVYSLRVLYFCSRCARAHAALFGRDAVQADDVEVVARLVLGHRAVSLPQPEEQEAQQESQPNDRDPSDPSSTEDTSESDEAGDDDQSTDIPLDDIIAEAVAAGAVSLQGLTAKLASRAQAAPSSGRVGAQVRSRQEGRPVGSEPGDPRSGGRLDVLATLRTAAPWAKLRPAPVQGSVVRVYPSDLRVRKYTHKTASSVIFLVDASGSSALNRLGEAKGAIEALLAECYARRDHVALVTFKGEQADLSLPPSRSLTRAKRSMAALPGGGGTPLASALALGLQTALQERNDGRSPLMVLFSDAQANVALDGTPGRAQARTDASKLASAIAAEGISVLFFDTSPRPNNRAITLGQELRATYTALPYADGAMVTQSVKAERDALTNPRV